MPPWWFVLYVASFLALTVWGLFEGRRERIAIGPVWAGADALSDVLLLVPALAYWRVDSVRWASPWLGEIFIVGLIGAVAQTIFDLRDDFPNPEWSSRTNWLLGTANAIVGFAVAAPAIYWGYLVVVEHRFAPM